MTVLKNSDRPTSRRLRNLGALAGAGALLVLGALLAFTLSLRVRAARERIQLRDEWLAALDEADAIEVRRVRGRRGQVFPRGEAIFRDFREGIRGCSPRQPPRLDSAVGKPPPRARVLLLADARVTCAIDVDENSVWDVGKFHPGTSLGTPRLRPSRGLRRWLAGL